MSKLKPGKKMYVCTVHFSAVEILEKQSNSWKQHYCVVYHVYEHQVDAEQVVTCPSVNAPPIPNYDQFLRKQGFLKKFASTVHLYLLNIWWPIQKAAGWQSNHPISNQKQGQHTKHKQQNKAKVAMAKISNFCLQYLNAIQNTNANKDSWLIKNNSIVLSRIHTQEYDTIQSINTN